MPAPSSQDLLAHATFLARLARKLVGDEHTAADLVQDTYATALAAPPRAVGSLRGWLAIVMRNRARNLRRDADRRTRRESSVARAEEAPPRDVPLERLEIQRVVIEEVLALSDEKRTVLYLRYSEDLTPSQIARRLDVPVKTIKTRHTRALAELRARLDERTGGDRSRWVSALLVLRVPRVASGRTALVTKAAVVAGAGALGFAAWFLLPREPEPEPELAALAPVASAEARVPLEPVSARRSAIPVPAASAPVAAPVPATPGATLFGRVVDHDGTPVPHARVEARSDPYFHPERVPDRVVESDAEGAFRVEGLGAAFNLTASAPELACEWGLVGGLAPGVEARGLELVLKEAVSFHGRVTDVDGRVLEGVRLELDGASGTSDRDATATPGVRRFHPVRLSITSDATGSFILGPVPRQRWNVRFTHPEHLRLDSTLDPGLDVQELVLERGLVLRGRVRLADGSAAGGAEVTVRDELVQWRKTTTDPGGLFELRGLAPSEDGLLLVNEPASAVFVRQPVRIALGQLPLDLLLEAPAALRGRVVDGEGHPLASARVRVEGDRRVRLDYLSEEPATWEWQLDQGQTTSDEEGRFVFDRLYPGLFTVRASPADASEPEVRASVRSGGDPIELVFDRERVERAVLAGRVIDGATGEPVRSFVVRPMRASAEDASSDTQILDEGVTLTTTSVTLTGRSISFGPEADGRFRLAGHEPGRMQLEVEALGYAPWQGDLREYALGETWHEVRLWKSCGARFVVRDAGGKAVGGRLVFHDLDGRRLRVEPLGMNVASIPPDGGAVSGLPATVLRVQASAPNCLARTLDLDLTRTWPDEPIEIVLERDADWELVQVSLVVLVTAETELTGVRTPQEAVEAWRSGRARPPEEDVELQFLDGADRVLAEGTITPNDSGGFHGSDKAMTASDGSSWLESVSDREEPSLDLHVPAAVRQVAVTLGDREPVRLSLALSTTDRNLVGVVLAEGK